MVCSDGSHTSKTPSRHFAEAGSRRLDDKAIAPIGTNRAHLSARGRQITYDSELSRISRTFAASSAKVKGFVIRFTPLSNRP